MLHTRIHWHLHRLMLCFLACGLAFGTIQSQTKKTMTISIWEGTDNTDSDRANAKLYCFLPEKSNGKAVIICPGGGYQGLCMDYEGTDFATWFNEHDIAAFVLQYRLPATRNAVPLADADRAIVLIRENAAKWGIDSEAIGIMGSSAGGHLASTLATHFTTASRPDFQILLYPVITMDESYTHLGSRQALLGTSPAASLVNKYSNERQVKTNTPQAFVVVSAADELVPVKNSLQYVQALINKKIPASLHIYPGGFHGFGHLARFEDYEMWHNELLYWLDQEVKATVPEAPEDSIVSPEPTFKAFYDKPILKQTSQLSDNCYWVFDGFDMSVNTLLDHNTATHFHSDATNTTPLSQLNQYIQMDMLEPQSMVQLYYAGRDLQPIGPVTNPSLSMINSPNHIIIKGTNTPNNESSWTQLAEFTEGFPGVVVAGEYFSPAIQMETPMRYLRMIVKGAEQSNVYWNISELQLYPCEPLNPDAVGAPKMEKASTSATYTLDGRQVSDNSALREGVYIVDGKKVVKGN